MSRPTNLFAPGNRVINKIPLGAAGAPLGLAPSIDFGGNALQDPRLAFGAGNSSGCPAFIGWLNAAVPKVTWQVPSAVSTTNIAAAQLPTSGTKLTLVSATGAGITYISTATFALPNYGNAIPVGSLAIDGVPGWLAVNGVYNNGFYDPTKGIARAVSVTGVASGSGGTVTIKGADWYGYSMTQTITLAAGANTVNTTKCFKFIFSVTPNFTDTHNISVGTADVYGLNIAADTLTDVDCYWNNALVTSPTFVAAVTATASATTGDVRGTFAPASSSDGTKTLGLFVQASAARLTQTPQSVGLFGVTQF